MMARNPTGRTRAANMRNQAGSARVSRSATPTREIGVSGTPIYGGYISSGEKSGEWTGAQKYVTIRDLVTNISIVAAGTRHFLNLVSRPKWSLVPATDQVEDQDTAAFVEEVLHDTQNSFPNVVRRSANFRFYGFGIQEWTAKKRKDGRIGLKSIEPRPQHTIEQWDVTESGEVNGVIQRSPQTGALLGMPRSKIIYMVDDTLTDSPEGLGVFRHLGEPYNRLKRYLDLEARAFERDLRGIPVGRAPITLIREAEKSGSLTPEQASSMITALDNFVKLQSKESDTGIVMDSMPYESQTQDGTRTSSLYQWSLELLQGSANGLSEINVAIDRLQREMARIIGTEHLLLGDRYGNRALSQDKSRNLYLIANGTLADIVEAYQRDLISVICDLNAIPEESRPKAAAEDVSFRDAAEVAQTLKDMAAAGALLAPDDPAIGDVRDLLGVSRPDEIMVPDIDQISDDGDVLDDDMDELAGSQ